MPLTSFPLAGLRGRRGFSLVEVIVATLVLGLGVVGLVTASATTSQLLGESRRATRAAQAAERRLELLRQTAALAPACGLLASGSVVTPADGISERWTVSGSGPARRASVEVGWIARRRPHTDTVSTLIRCR